MPYLKWLREAAFTATSMGMPTKDVEIAVCRDRRLLPRCHRNGDCPYLLGTEWFDEWYKDLP